MNTTMAQWASEHFFKIFLAVIVLNLFQRRHQKTSARKRLATLYLAVAVFLLMVVGQFIVVYGGSDLHFLAACLVAAYLVYHFRAYTLPFAIYSRKDGRRFTMEEILYMDDPDSQDAPENLDQPDGEEAPSANGSDRPDERDPTGQ